MRLIKLLAAGGVSGQYFGVATCQSLKYIIAGLTAY